MSDKAHFKLPTRFVAQYAKKQVPWGFGVLSELVYYRTFSRIKPDGSNEKWFETVRRVVEGTYTMQQRWILSQSLGWNEDRAQKSAAEMYDRMFSMKFLPPGRGLWAMGSAITEERGLYAALNNCAFVSTHDENDVTAPYCFLMDMSMLGVGVGFDTKGGNVLVHRPNEDYNAIYTIPDTREGWVNSVRLLLESYFLPKKDKVIFDYTFIRGAGEPIKGFGGVASGPAPLIELHSRLVGVLDARAGGTLGTRGVADIMNMIGACVVAGNVRRTAEICFGDPADEEFLDLKNYELNPDRAMYGWTSNNSIFAEIGMNYHYVADRTRRNGEPGYEWLENAQDYGRMSEPPNYKDWRATGGNPCLEQTLENYELCCLVETFPNKHDSLEDYKRTLKFAYLYAKTVTLGATHWEETNRVMKRNRRIGTSMTGIAQFIANRGIHQLHKWCDAGYDAIQHYDERYSDWFGIPRSIKTTSVKPSGTVSILAGATPGVHYPEAKQYIRRVRLSVHSPLVEPLKRAGYVVEPAAGSEASTVVVEIPVDVGEVRTAAEVSIWEQLELAAFLQAYWADNQVSVTVTFDPETEGQQIERCLDFYQYRLKGVSFLPRIDYGAYPQMPYEAISASRYAEIVAGLKPLNLSVVGEEAEPDMYCDNDSCEVI